MGKEIYIDVAKQIESQSALTQEQGNIIYAKIEEAIKNKQAIKLDFSGIKRMISPFLNNAIGQLYGKYNREQISEYLFIENFPDEKKSTLNIVIANAKRYYKNKEQYSAIVEEVINSWAQLILILLFQRKTMYSF